MFCGDIKVAKKSVFDIAVLILLVTQFIGVYGVPINFANNNKNHYNENHANRPLPYQAPLPVPPQQQRSASPYQKQQTGQNQGPEMEDFGRLHTNQKQFRRHAIVPPDAKAATGAFQQSPPEQFGQNGGASGPSFRQNMLDESHQKYYNHIYMHQQPPPSFIQAEDASDFHQRSSHGQNHFHVRQHSHEMPPSPSGFPNHFNSPHEDARPNNNHIPNQQHYQQMLNDNEILREKNVFQHAWPDERASAFPSQRGKSPVEQHYYWQEQQPTGFPNTFTEFPGKPNNVPASLATPQPTAVAVVVPGGNSTLFIEYDVSDNDVTYETIVEVEDQPESAFISNHVSPVK